MTVRQFTRSRASDHQIERGAASADQSQSSIRPVSPRQLVAVRAVMRLFVEDDLARGVPIERRRACDVCDTRRAAPGFIRYDRLDVCNGCATEFEFARLCGVARTIAEFMEVRHRRISA